MAAWSRSADTMPRVEGTIVMIFWMTKLSRANNAKVITRLPFCPFSREEEMTSAR